MWAERPFRNPLKSRSTPQTAGLSRFGRKSSELRPLPVRCLLFLHRSSSTIAWLVVKTGDRRKGRTTLTSVRPPTRCVHHQSSPSIEMKRGPRARTRRTGHEFQTEDHEFGPIAEDAAGQLLRRTGACGCQCVLCPGRRSEIDRRDRVRMLVTNIAAASYHDALLRVNAGNGLIAAELDYQRAMTPNRSTATRPKWTAASPQTT